MDTSTNASTTREYVETAHCSTGSQRKRRKLSSTNSTNCTANTSTNTVFSSVVGVLERELNGYLALPEVRSQFVSHDALLLHYPSRCFSFPITYVGRR
jgi:hypothetical protein